MPRFELFAPWNRGPHSHHWSSVGGRVLVYRMRSGRETDSTLMTSAPRQASAWVAAGPAHQAVQSRIRTPSRARTGSVGSGAAGRGDQRTWPEWAPRRGAGWNGRGSTPEIRYGMRGWTNRPPGFSTNTWRSTKWSKPVTVLPLPTGPLGMRSSDACSSSSAVVCCVVYS